LNNLTISLIARFLRMGSMSDLDCALATMEKAVSVTRAERPNLAMYLSNLSNILLGRVSRTGLIDDINRDIAVNEKAMTLIPTGHPNLPGIQTNLATVLCNRSQLTGSIDDLNRAIMMNQLVVHRDGQPRSRLNRDRQGPTETDRLWTEPNRDQQLVRSGPSRSRTAAYKTGPNVAKSFRAGW